LLPDELLRTKRTQKFRRSAANERTSSDLHACTDEAIGGDERLLTDIGIVHDDGIHADERAAPDGATVEDRSVPYVAVFFNQGVVAWETVQYTTVLNIGTDSHFDSAEVASQACQRPDVAIWTDDDVAN
jgi:hypothetical protein